MPIRLNLLIESAMMNMFSWFEQFLLVAEDEW